MISPVFFISMGVRHERIQELLGGGVKILRVHSTEIGRSGVLDILLISKIIHTNNISISMSGRIIYPV